MEPRFLSVEQVVRLHANQIDTYGGQHGVRDQGLLESAVAQPAAMFGGQFLCGDLAEMAAAYLFHIACTIPSSMAISVRGPWRPLSSLMPTAWS